MRLGQQNAYSDGSMSVSSLFRASLGASGCAMSTGAVGTRVGACCLWRASDASTAADHVSPGKLAVENVARGAKNESDDVRHNHTVPWVPWSLAEAVELRAAGAAIASFSLRATGPAFPSGVTPALAGGLPVSRTNGARVAFAPAGGGFAELLLLANGSGVECRAPDATGEVVVPPSLVTEAFEQDVDVYALLAKVDGEQRREGNVDATFELSAQVNFPKPTKVLP